jgi:hypothetical protein
VQQKIKTRTAGFTGFFILIFFISLSQMILIPEIEDPK